MNDPVHPSSDSRPILVWDLPLRVFHWSLATAFAGAYLLSESERWRGVHVALGWTVLGLVAFRVLWGWVGSRWARFASFAFGPRAALGYLRDLAAGRAPRYVGHNPAGSVVIYAILGLAALTGLSGWATYNGVGGERLAELHEGLAATWLAVVGVHLAGVLASSWLHRENLIAAMIVGTKRGAAVDSAGSPRWQVGATLAVALAGFWLWTALGGGMPGGRGVDEAMGQTGPGAAGSVGAEAHATRDD